MGKKTEKIRINLPKDELPHKNHAIEWWYFNGFMNSRKRKYAFMNCLFKASLGKQNTLLKILPQDFYFSHNILYDLSSKKLRKEIVPFVILSPESFKRRLFVECHCPIFKDCGVHKLFRKNGTIFLQNDFYQVSLNEIKKPLYENGTGFINLGEKSTFYYSYTNLKLVGKVGSEIVTGKAWHDRQWSRQGAMNDSWIWFSLQLPDNTEIVCFDYKGRKFANIIYENGKQETLPVEFKPIGEKWTSPRTKIVYNLEWKIKIKSPATGSITFKTKPFIKDCEVSFGSIHYWEGPIKVSFNGKKALGFMEYVLKPIDKLAIDIINKNEVAEFFDFIKDKFKSVSFSKFIEKRLL